MPREFVDLIVFEPDGVTPFLEVSDDPAHDHPYLLPLESADEARADFLDATLTTGQINVRAVDKRTAPEDQATGYITSKLGLDSSALSALRGRRVLVRGRVGVETRRILDGVLHTIELDLVDYVFACRDVRERERRAPAFERVLSTGVWPRGRTRSYGFLRATQPAVGVFEQLGAWGGRVDVSATWPGGTPSRWHYIPEAAQRVAEPEVIEEGAPTFEEFTECGPIIPWIPQGPGNELCFTYTIGTVPRKIGCPNLVALWRPARDAIQRARDIANGVDPAWNVLNMRSPAFDTAGGPVAALEVADVEDLGETYQAVVTAFLFDDSGATIPADNAEIEYMLAYVGVPSETFPALWWGEAGEFLELGYAGEFTDGAPLHPIEVSEAAAAAMPEPLLVYVDSRVDDFRSWLRQHVFQALGAVPCQDTAGAIAPVRHEIPDNIAAAATVVQTAAGLALRWRHVDEPAINTLAFRYRRVWEPFTEPYQNDPGMESTNAAGLRVRDVEVRRIHAPSRSIHDEALHEIESHAVTAVGTPSVLGGQPIGGELSGELGANLAEQRAWDLFPRYGDGARVVEGPIRRSLVGERGIGDWLRFVVPWLPQYETGLRGMDEYGQITSVSRVDPLDLWVAVELVDVPAGARPERVYPLPVPVQTDWQVEHGDALTASATLAVDKILIPVVVPKSISTTATLGEAHTVDKVDTTPVPESMLATDASDCPGAVAAYQIDLSWVNASSEFPVRISRRTGAGSWAPLVTLSAATNSYRDEDLDACTAYHYTAAYEIETDVYGPESNESFAETPFDPCNPELECE